LGLGASVDMPGFVKNPFAYLRRSALFVLSSAWEGFGNVVVEALAMGVPVVSTDCPHGPREILDNGRYGTLVNVGDPDGMARAMLEALRSPVDGSRLKQRALDFGVDRIADRYLKLLQLIR
jgi:glycosyltransferase involved in cell wall biosynthesis